MTDKTTLLKSIEQLLNSNTSANNYLGLTMLCQQLQLPFAEAFKKLHFVEETSSNIVGISQYKVLIADYEVFFSVEHCWNEDEAFPYLAIRRFVKQGNKRVKKYDMYISVDYFESEKERDLYEALMSLSNLSEGLEDVLMC